MVLSGVVLVSGFPNLTIAETPKRTTLEGTGNPPGPTDSPESQFKQVFGPSVCHLGKI